MAHSLSSHMTRFEFQQKRQLRSKSKSCADTRALFLNYYLPLHFHTLDGQLLAAAAVAAAAATGSGRRLSAQRPVLRVALHGALQQDEKAQVCSRVSKHVWHKVALPALAHGGHGMLACNAHFWQERLAVANR